MARYNRWQNTSLIAAAETLEPAALLAERGAFWGSIHGTLSHILWADHVWMARLDGWPPPGGGLSDSDGYAPDWAELRARRRITDARIARWAGALGPADLANDLVWQSGAAGREVARPRAICVLHMFNHQTHHRGQVHAMLTAAGAAPGDTDLFLMPDMTN
ncbi:damage-inducible protein DinB [Rhodovulum iodosum]|nr:damage-inducible protein DinB [Rhodovulum robiginosum]